MKRLKSGPELKMPEMKVPPFLKDLYWDLRDRRLLPLVGLAIVAIIAAPFLLGGDSQENQSPPPTATTAIASEAGSEASSLTVVAAKPGLRQYSKRLAHRKPTDPFKQRYTAPPSGQGPELNPETSSESEGSSSTSSEGSSPAPSPSEPSRSPSAPESTPNESSGKGGGGSGNPSQMKLYAFAINVKIIRVEGGESKSKPDTSTRQKVMPTTPLPGEKAPVVTYMGVGKGAKSALLMVSNNVKSIYGDAKCLSGTDTCQLLEVEPGLPETFVYGDNGARYKVNVLKIEPVYTGHT